jgi:hypothetical protein
MITDDGHEETPNILSTCGFYVTKNRWKCQLGTVFKNVVNLYYPDAILKHILFTRPFMWEDKLLPMKLSLKTVHFLVGIPISDTESGFLEQNGFAALEYLFISKKVNYGDFKRESLL